MARSLRVTGLMFVLGFASHDLAYAGYGYGGCTDPCLTYRWCTPSAPYASKPYASTPAPYRLDTGPVTELRVVLVPSYVTEKKYVCSTDYTQEERQRTVSYQKTVPVTEERARVTSVMVPRTETKTVEYSATVPHQSMATKEYRIKVPVWDTREEEYTVQVPVLREVPQEYVVQVPVLKDVPFTYTVNVPTPVTQVVTRHVTTAVPVVRTRTISQCVPVTSTRRVSVDRGHWENRVTEQPAYSAPAHSHGCGTYGGCGQANYGGYGQGNCGRSSYGGGCGNYVASAPRRVCHRVWVPNVVTEDVTEVHQTHQTTTVEYLVYEQYTKPVPYECTTIVYQPETRTGTKKQVSYVPQTRTRPRTVVEYQPQSRKRLSKVLAYRDEVRSETYPVIEYTQERRTKEISYTIYVPESKVEPYTTTRYDQVTEQKIETYLARVAVPVVKAVDVTVCKMVPKVVSVTIEPCATQGYRGGCAPLSVPYHHTPSWSRCCGQ